MRPGLKRSLLLPAARRRNRRTAFTVQCLFACSAVFLFAALEYARGGTGNHGSEPYEMERRLQTLPTVFSLEQQRQGAVILHLLCLLYMFLGIAIICDDYFVSSLEHICEYWAISDDVAGATFMAAGGSAPEFATSFLAVFVFKSDVGFGTIVGSAVFNVLFVIGLCAYFSGIPQLKLTWYPLMRDASYYLVCLGILVAFVIDKEVVWYEAFVLVMMYFGYVTIMKFDPQIKEFIISFEAQHIGATGSGKVWLSQQSTRTSKVMPIDSCSAEASENAKSNASVSCTASVAPAPRVQESAESAKAQEALPSASSAPEVEAQAVDMPSPPASPPGEPPPPGGDDGHPPEAVEMARLAEQQLGADGALSQQQRSGSCVSFKDGMLPGGTAPAGAPMAKPFNRERSRSRMMTPEELVKKNLDGSSVDGNGSVETKPKPAAVSEAVRSDSGAIHQSDNGAPPQSSGKNDKDVEAAGEEEEDDSDKSWIPQWPDTPLKQLCFLATAPLTFAFAFTVPDCRISRLKKYYAYTFINSIIWIGILTWVMVSGAEHVGDTIGVPESVMGVTVLAAGTSIPDALSSVLVAREGHGDMALSSSIGSNVFDITFGLPIPWLMSTGMVWPGTVISIKSGSMPIQVGTLMLMVVAVVASIHIFHWNISKPLGIFFFVLYFIFVAEAILLELCVIPCVF